MRILIEKVKIVKGNKEHTQNHESENKMDELKSSLEDVKQLADSLSLTVYQKMK